MINITKPIITDNEISAVVDVMRSGTIAQGPKVAELEEKFAAYCGTKYAVAFNSGTAAIHAGLYSLGIKEGDEVITTPFTFIATANPILMQGAKVVFADISESDFNLDPKEVEKKITKKTKAIVPVDLYGQVFNYKDLRKLAAKNGIKIVEDACQSAGAEQSGEKSGNFGDLAAFSLYATKNIMCAEGGLVTTNDLKIAENCKMFRHHGQSEKVKYEYFDLGYNYRLTDISAAIALEQLKKIDVYNNKRIHNAEKYLQGLVGIKGLVLPKVNQGNKHVFHQFTLRITPDSAITREEFIAKLTEAGIGSGIYYPKPLHMHQCFKKYGYREGDFPISEKIAKEVVSLPVHPLVAEQEIGFITKTIKKIYKV